MELRLFEYDKIIKEQKKKIEEYQKLNAVEKYIKKLKREKLKEVKPVLFAVKYKDIGFPYQKIDGFRVWCNYELYNASIDQIPDPNIDDLWTIVQYEGDGEFTDLTTDKKFRLAHYEEYVREKLSKIRTGKDYKEACNIYEGLIKIPLGISDESKHLDNDFNPIYFGPLHELTPEIEMEVVKHTIAKKDNIARSLSIKEEIARKSVMEKYKQLYSDVLFGNIGKFEQEDVNKRYNK